MVISIVSISIAISVYLENRRSGAVVVFTPTRYGYLGGEHHSNKSDKILLAFTIHNDGNVFRNVEKVWLEIIDPNKENLTYTAIGKFDKLKKLIFKENPLTENEYFSLVSSFSMDKHQYLSLNFLFYLDDSKDWPGGNRIHKLHQGKHEGVIKVKVTRKAGNEGYSTETYSSQRFDFMVHYAAPTNWIDTFTDIMVLPD